MLSSLRQRGTAIPSQTGVCVWHMMSHDVMQGPDRPQRSSFHSLLPQHDVLGKHRMSWLVSQIRASAGAQNLTTEAAVAHVSELS